MRSKPAPHFLRRPRVARSRRLATEVRAAAPFLKYQFERGCKQLFASDACESDLGEGLNQYYPREWYAQTEYVNRGMASDATDWQRRAGVRKVGAVLDAEERRTVFWDMERAMRQASVRKRDGLSVTELEDKNQKEGTPATGAFYLPYLDWSLEKGCRPLLPPKVAFEALMHHRRVVDMLRVAVSGTPHEAAPLEHVVMNTAFDATQSRVHMLAAEHFNMLFFWKCIVPYGSVHVPDQLNRVLWRWFCPTAERDKVRKAKGLLQSEGALEELKARMKREVMDHGTGADDTGRFVWLVLEPRSGALRVRSTGGEVAASSPISVGLIPLLGCCIGEHVMRAEDGEDDVDRADRLDSYFERFWLCTDWDWVGRCYEMATKEQTFLSIDIYGRKSKSDVHVFPSQPTFRDKQLQTTMAQGGRDDPLEHTKAQYNAWRDIRRDELENQISLAPGVDSASRDHQDMELTWHLGQQYHILSAHAALQHPYPNQNIGWLQTERSNEQLKVKSELERTAVHPAPSGLSWPEEKLSANNPLLVSPLEHPDELPVFEEDTEKPWEEAEEKWLHGGVHEVEYDFRKRFAPREGGNDFSQNYYGHKVIPRR
eukprot:Hpha_TRINITY_DN2738_c0_g1::TRINITY_DN2738_c0_g1_i1::g.110377::m.110377